LLLGENVTQKPFRDARPLGHECGAEDFFDSVREINVVGIVVIVIVSHHSPRACISMPRIDIDTRAYIGFLSVIIKARAGTTSEGPKALGYSRSIF